MTTPHIITLPEARSTNTELAAIAAASPHGTVVTTRCQTAGRGQRGNTWESAPGRNITMSVLLKPDTILAREQFAVSEAVSLAIVTVLRRHLPVEAKVAIKWPNDIYVNDLKICGILIENSLVGNRIGHSIAGIGININQERFLSDAPNPVSLFQLTGRVTPLDEIEREFVDEILATFSRVDRHGGALSLHGDYIESLWRNDGYYPYLDPATGTRLSARIVDVAPTGHLTLAIAPDDHASTYAFKEITALL